MIQYTEIDGVPTLFTPSDGPMHAGLTFRVGRADETLARSGITHLVEHLALHRHGLTDYHFNGATGSIATHFHMQGAEPDVVAFLTGVCDGLTNLPLDRLETEKAILRTEESSRAQCANDAMALWRYGAQNYGLVSYPEYGLPALRPEDVHWWAQTWFTRENAVFWIAGDRIPPNLRLPLFSGNRRPVPVPSSALPVTPAYFVGSPQGVVLDAVVKRGVAASAYAGVLERELFRSLRQEGGFSYTATTSYDARGDGAATITALADALPEKQDAVLGGFIDVLMKLKVGRVEQADLDAVRVKADESLRHRDANAGRLPSSAVNLLTGHQVRQVDELRAELAAVTVHDVHAVAVETMNSALLLAPGGGACPDWTGFTAAPTASAAAVTGTRHRSREDGDTSLIVGAEGASLVSPEGALTVRFDECAAQLVWPDGGRQLIGRDGISFRIEPTLFAIDPAALSHFDAGIPPLQTVPLPPRRPEAIPRPVSKAERRAAAPRRGWLEISAIVALILFASLCGCTSLLGTVGFAADDATDSASWVLIGVTWVFTVALAAGAVLVWRRRGRS